MNGNNKALFLGLGAAAIVAIVLVLVLSNSTTTDEGASEATGGEMTAGFGGKETRAELWRQLSAYQDTYLVEWKDGFRRANPSAASVLKAFNTVVTKVTGPDGFWRDTVPNELFKCHTNHDDQVCEQLDEAYDEFADWDALSRRIDRLDDSRADVFLTRNQDAMKTYLQTYVPTTATAEGMLETAFFQQKLHPHVAGAEAKKP